MAIHYCYHYVYTLKELTVEDVTLIINDHVFEAKIVLGNWCYNMSIGRVKVMSCMLFLIFAYYVRICIALENSVSKSKGTSTS